MRSLDRIFRRNKPNLKTLAQWVKSLFSTGVNGAWYDPSDINLTWRRNLLTYTEQFDNAAWAKGNSAVTTNATTAPDGTTSAELLYPLTTGSDRRVIQTGLVLSAASYTASAYIKAAGKTWAYMLVPQASTINDVVWFNLSTGAVGTKGSSATSASMQDAGNGWYKCTVTGPGTASSAFAINVADADNATSVTASGTSGIYIWGAQLEVGNTATPYQRITDGIKDYLDYKPLPILYQDAAGTTPVTAVGQPVGLMLDKSKGLVLGGELVTNGDFSNGTTGWTVGTGLSVAVVAGQAQVTRSGGITASAAFQNSVTVTSGKTYVVKIDVITNNGAARNITNDAGTPFTGASPAAFVGTGTFTFVITATDTKVRINLWTNDGSTSTFDNISVRELPGNHAYNPSGNSANFPVLSARYNLLTKTEALTDSGTWARSGLSTVLVANSEGLNKLVEDSTTGEHKVLQNVVLVSGQSYKIRIRAKAAERTLFSFYGSGGLSIGPSVFVDLTYGIVTGGTNATITLVGNGVYEISTDATSTFTGANAIHIRIGTTSYAGDGVSGIFIGQADLRVANDALNQPAYQRVNTATDYDTVGFKPYLSFNGVNQWLQTNSIDFTYGDKMFVSAGVRKLSDVANAVVVELSSDGTANSGIFNIFAPIAGSASYRFVSKGTLAGSAISAAASYPAPHTAVLSGIGSISTDTDNLRVNEALFTGSVLDQGTGNYGNYPLYIGARTGSSLWFNGRLYGLVIAGKAASASEITSCERYLNQKTGAY